MLAATRFSKKRFARSESADGERLPVGSAMVVTAAVLEDRVRRVRQPSDGVLFKALEPSATILRASHLAPSDHSFRNAMTGSRRAA